jgi:hypothetical protein
MHPNTKRRRIVPHRRLGWVAPMLEERRPPGDYADWQEFVRWQEGRLAVPGLPDPGSPEGERLLAGLKVSLR